MERIWIVFLVALVVPSVGFSQQVAQDRGVGDGVNRTSTSTDPGFLALFGPQPQDGGYAYGYGGLFGPRYAARGYYYGYDGYHRRGMYGRGGIFSPNVDIDLRCIFGCNQKTVVVGQRVPSGQLPPGGINHPLFFVDGGGATEPAKTQVTSALLRNGCRVMADESSASHLVMVNETRLDGTRQRVDIRILEKESNRVTGSGSGEGNSVAEAAKNAMRDVFKHN